MTSSSERSRQIAHQHVGPDAEGAQVMGQLVGAGVELGVGELLILEDHGHGVGRACGLLLEELVDARSRG